MNNRGIDDGAMAQGQTFFLQTGSCVARVRWWRCISAHLRTCSEFP